ncbi:hypothetical protein BN1723_019981, partial [Verticillium longisporum]
DHIVNNCIAFGNAAKGFTDNKQTGTFLFTRNTAYNNGAVGFQTSAAKATFQNNIAARNSKTTAQSGQTSLKSATSTGNSWNGSPVWTDASFKSVDVSLVKGARQANGKIVASNFLLPASGGNIGATTNWQ